MALDSQEELATMMANSFQNVATKDDLERVLDIVEIIEKNTRGLKNLPARITQNEADIFKIKANLR